MHELGHALGFYHEHERRDRDRFIQVLRDNVLPNALRRFDIQDHVAAVGAPYDYASIMHFSLYEYSRNGLKTLVPLSIYEGVIGQRKGLSRIDKELINDIYPCLDIGKFRYLSLGVRGKIDSPFPIIIISLQEKSLIFTGSKVHLHMYVILLLEWWGVCYLSRKSLCCACNGFYCFVCV